MQSELKPTSMPVYGVGAHPVARQLAVRGERGVHVAGHVDLRHDLDEPLGGVRDDAPVVALRVVAARTASDGARRADARQPRPRADRDPPALVVGQVQVQPVQLVEREQVDQSLDLGDAEEVPRDVEHHPAPREARPVVDREHRNVPRPAPPPARVDRGREQLPERLGAAEEPGRRAGNEHDATRLDRQPVALVAERAVGGPQDEPHVPVCRRTAHGRHRQPEARRRAQRLGEESSDGAGGGVAATEDDPRVPRQLERASPGRDRERLGNDRGKGRRPVSHARRRT